MADLVRIIRGFAVVVCAAIVLSAAVTLFLVGPDPHPECAWIPGDVGPCAYWDRVRFIGEFVMPWGTIVGAGVIATVWLWVAATSALIGWVRTRFARRHSETP